MGVMRETSKMSKTSKMSETSKISSIEYQLEIGYRERQCHIDLRPILFNKNIFFPIFQKIYLTLFL
jgi:hypothetical protein